MSFDLYQSLADLRSGWNKLPDLERASQIRPLLKAGMSRRTLAKALGISEGLVRRLVVLQEALPEEKLLARKGRMSTNQLVRAVKNRRQHQAVRLQEKAEQERQTKARMMAEEIAAWLNHVLAPGYAEQIVEEARRRLAIGELTGRLPRGKAPEGASLQEIITRCKPSSVSDELPSETCAVWLTLWAFYAIPDSDIREKALSIAWEKAIG